MSRRGWSIWIALLALALPVLSVAGPAQAGTEPRLTLIAQDAWTPVGGDFHFQVGIEGAAPDSSLSVIAHSRVESFDGFEQSASGDELGGTLEVVDVPIALLTSDASGNRAVRVGLDAPGEELPNQLPTRRSGVYPLEIELRDANTETLDRFVTYLVVVAAAGTEGAITSPLGVAWVWPLVTRPTVRANGLPDRDVVDQLQNDGRLGRQVLTLAEARDVPVTVVPSADTVETWTTLAEDDESVADGALALRGLGISAQVLAGPYVPVNFPSLLRAGMTGAVETQLVRGGTSLGEVFDDGLDTETALVDPVDSATLGRLVARNVTRVIIDEGALVDRESDLTAARPFQLDAPFVADTAVTALAADRRLADLLSGDAAAAVRAQRFLAALSVIAFEHPDSAHAVAVLNPRGFDERDGVLEAALGGLRNHPWLRPMRVGDVFDTVPTETTDDGSPLVRELAANNPPAPPVTAEQYDEQSIRLASFQLFAPGAPGTSAAQRALLSSVSSDWAGPLAGEGTARLRAIDEVINGFLSRIRVPAPSTITLTDRSGDIPLTVRNSTGQPVKVLIVLQSPKLSFPNGPEQLITLPRRNTTVRFAVEARTSGSFPLRLTVRSANGALTIAQARFRVEATAVSTVGLVLIVSAVTFLALWWLIHIRRERHRKRRRMRQPVPVT